MVCVCAACDVHEVVCVCCVCECGCELIKTSGVHSRQKTQVFRWYCMQGHVCSEDEDLDSRGLDNRGCIVVC